MARRVDELADSLRPILHASAGRAGAPCADTCRAESWRLVEASGIIHKALAPLVSAARRAPAKELAAEMEEFSLMLWRMEADLHPFLDTWTYLRTLRKRLLGRDAGFD